MRAVTCLLSSMLLSSSCLACVNVETKNGVTRRVVYDEHNRLRFCSYKIDSAEFADYRHIYVYNYREHIYIKIDGVDGQVDASSLYQRGYESLDNRFVGQCAESDLARHSGKKWFKKPVIFSVVEVAKRFYA